MTELKNKAQHDLCEVFAARLMRLGGHIQANNLSPIEANELLAQEAEKLRNEKSETND